MPPQPGRPFTITELRRTGAGVLEETPVSFRWDAASHTMPREAIEMSLVVATVRTVPPGSDEPVEQVLSASWEPFELQGEWRDRWAGRGFAMATYTEFARLVARGSLVRLAYGPLAVVGLLQRLTLRYERDTKVGWSVTFSPHRHETVGSPRRGRVVQPQARPISDYVSQAQAAEDRIAESLELARDVPIGTDLREAAADDLEALQGVVQRLDEAGRAGFEEDAIQKLLAVGALMRSVRGAAQQVIQRFARARSDLHVAYDDAIATLRFDEWTRQAAADARLLVLRSTEGEQDMQVRAKARPRAIHRAKAGESPERISVRYYGTPDGWRAIWEANNLSTIVLRGGEELIIPERSP